MPSHAGENYKAIFNDIIHHKHGKYTMLDFGGDQAAISVFAYDKTLRSIGVNRAPKINSLVQLSALPEKEFLKKYDVGTRWLYPKASKRTRELNEEYSAVINVDVEKEIRSGFVMGNADRFFYDEWGVKWQRSAYYFEQVKHPLQDLTYQEVRNYEFPNPEDPLRLQGTLIELEEYQTENPNYVILFSQSYGGILETALWLRGFEQFYMDLSLNTKICDYLLDAITDYLVTWTAYFLRELKGRVDVVAIGDDYGMQDRMLMSPETWREKIKPRHKHFIESFKNKFSHTYMFHHTCGSVTPIVEDLIDNGVDILNPIQPTAKGMEPSELKSKFGRRITFHGGIDVQKLLPNAEPRRIREEVLRIMEILSEDGGYIVAPSHNIQAETPTENIISFYDAVMEFKQMHCG